jgi:hypothetical protein
MLTGREDQSDTLKSGRQRRDGGQQEALGRVVQVLEEGEGRLNPVIRVDRSKAAGPGAQRYQEQERNRSNDCSGTYPNCGQLSPTDPSWAGVSLFPQVISRWCG